MRSQYEPTKVQLQSQLMNLMATMEATISQPTIKPENGTPPARKWLFSPTIDLLFVCNVLWPLVFLLQNWTGIDGRDGLIFWQVYFVTTPHRWISMLLVFGDRDRFASRRFIFLAVLATAIGVCSFVQISTGTLTCLLTIDYLWNAWHFAAQHHGVYRIYGRLTGKTEFEAKPVFAAVEKWGTRVFVIYAALRVTGWTWSYESLERTLSMTDWFVILTPALLLFYDLKNWRSAGVGRTVYMLSVWCLYSGMILSVHFQRADYVLMLATASALFHAAEYLAIVSWSVSSRKVPKENDLLSRLVPAWLLMLSIYILVLGIAGYLVSTHFARFWLFLNVVVAFLHYSYDGLIWRRRRA